MILSCAATKGDGPMSHKDFCCGDCEPMCRACNRMADEAAANRQEEWEDAGYYDTDSDQEKGKK